MSRIGKKIIVLPDKVELTLVGAEVVVKGPKGELKFTPQKFVTVEINGREVEIKVKNSADKFQRSIWGTTRSLLQNNVTGVSQGFSRQLEINGVGHKAEMKGNKLALSVGFSHPVEFNPPTGITISTEKNIITIAGIDKQQVSQVAANIRAIKKPEPYKGKGIKYVEEVIRRKAGKVAKGGEK